MSLLEWTESSRATPTTRSPAFAAPCDVPTLPTQAAWSLNARTAPAPPSECAAITTCRLRPDACTSDSSDTSAPATASALCSRRTMGLTPIDSAHPTYGTMEPNSRPASRANSSVDHRPLGTSSPVTRATVA
eukprot:scaffold69892_cov71-Phaeocystis_antarctica.AAC.7